jgi:hypothetical protein
LQFPTQSGAILSIEMPAEGASALISLLRSRMQSSTTRLTILAGAVVTGLSCTGCDVSVKAPTPTPKQTAPVVTPVPVVGTSSITAPVARVLS